MSGVRYSLWRDGSLGIYEVVRWDGDGAAVIVQTNLVTREKAAHALAEWREREQLREQLRERMGRLDAMELDMSNAIARLKRETDDA